MDDKLLNYLKSLVKNSTVKYEQKKQNKTKDADESDRKIYDDSTTEKPKYEGDESDE